MRLRFLATGLALVLVLSGGTTHASMVPSPPAIDTGALARLATDADPHVLELALASMRCAQAGGAGSDANRLAVIDYSRSSLQPRLWVFDLAKRRLLYSELVAHGQGSGEDVPTHFSNDDGSHASSLGLFLTLDTYHGHNGLSLRMEGLEPGFNDAAKSRAIVMHGAAYVNADRGRQLGRLGRSWGCPALRSVIAAPVIDALKGGQFVFSYYPDDDWLTRSALLHCPAAGLARNEQRPHDGPA